jgi:hypothetical protein
LFIFIATGILSVAGLLSLYIVALMVIVEFAFAYMFPADTLTGSLVFINVPFHWELSYIPVVADFMVME